MRTFESGIPKYLYVYLVLRVSNGMSGPDFGVQGLGLGVSSFKILLVTGPKPPALVVLILHGEGFGAGDLGLAFLI